jgi:hypothetical protein
VHAKARRVTRIDTLSAERSTGLKRSLKIATDDEADDNSLSMPSQTRSNVTRSKQLSVGGSIHKINRKRSSVTDSDDEEDEDR